MALTIHLVSTLYRLEETLIEKALSNWARVVKVNPKNSVFRLKEGTADAAVIRPVSLYESIYTAAVYESTNVYTVNNSRSLMTAGDKLLTYAALTRSSVPIPRTIYVPASNHDPRINTEYPVVTKPPIGSWGRLVSKARNEEELHTLLELRNNIPCTIQRNLLVQEYIENHGDIRCIVINNKLAGCIKRKPVKGDWRANVALGGKTTQIKPTPTLEETAVKAAQTIGGYFLSIDLFETKNGETLVNEINGVPEFKGFLKATNKNPAETLSQELKETLKK
jgi:glutamate--LysW ligase ArgX